MNYLHLGHRLGAVSTPTLQRTHNESTLYSLTHDERTTFSLARLAGDIPPSANIAHNNGVNCLALRSDILVTGGADACLRVWNLSQPNPPNHPTYHPVATLTRTPTAHTNALTSLSIYPFDPTPTTILSTSYDTNLLLSTLTPTALQPLHHFPLTHAIHTHAISPLPSTTPLIATGTASPYIRLLDLRSGLATHALPGHNGAVYTLGWSPTTSHILASGATDGRVLFFDVRRANAAFASLDADDAIGVSSTSGSSVNRLGGKSGALLDFSKQAHQGPVTSVQWTPNGQKIVTAGHDQRIRVWDAATGRNELVHFGPRIKNARQGEFGPLLVPEGYDARKGGGGGGEVLVWANDDARGEVGVYGVREGDLRATWKVGGVLQGSVAKERGGGRNDGMQKRRTGRGRVNAMVWRKGWEEGCAAREGLEMVSAHGDGTVGVWRVPEDDDGVVMDVGTQHAHARPNAGADGSGDSEEDDDDDDHTNDGRPRKKRKKKKKKQDLNALVAGLTGMR